MSSRIILLALLGALVTPARADDARLGPGEFDPAAWTALLSRYVHGDGVDFDGWREAGTDGIDAFLAAAGAWDPGTTLSKEAKASWLLNLHNAFAVRQVLGAAPGTAPRDIEGFSDGNTLPVGDEALTLVDLRKRLEAQAPILPEVLFAPYTCERGGPRLPDRAYTSGNLDELVPEVTLDLLEERGGFSWDPETKVLVLPPAVEEHAAYFETLPNGLSSVLSRYITLSAVVWVSQHPESIHIADIDRSLDAAGAGDDE